MKTFFVLTFLVFLVGCTAEAPGDTAVTEQVIVEQAQNDTTLSDIDAAIDTLPETDELVDELLEDVNDVSADSVSSDDSEIIELGTTYKNPAMEVVMNIEYNLDDAGNITEIAVTSPNYEGMPQFNQGVQAVVGMTVSEASEYVVAGSSLTTPAFQNALKETL